MGSIFLQSHVGGSDTPAGSESSRDGGILSSNELQARVHSLLSVSSKTHEARGKADASSRNTTFADPGTTVPSCVRDGIGRPQEQELASRQEEYGGKDAYLVVLPHPGDLSLVDAYYVASSCATASSSTPGEVLRNETVPRS
ncbi:hypothetical protein ACFQ2B_15785 [Streptomyces stramineus]